MILGLRISVGESRGHLPPIKIELVHFGEDPQKKEERRRKINVVSELLKEDFSKDVPSTLEFSHFLIPRVFANSYPHPTFNPKTLKPKCLTLKPNPCPKPHPPNPIPDYNFCNS